ncbi:MAG: putative metal-binding motif-containing protein, partial [Pseudomonadota bacterium]
MARPLMVPLFAFLLSACGSSWSPVDADGDGFSPLEGDCWDAIEGPTGFGLSGADIHPGAAETWYDGLDQDCAGDDDYDADGDGYIPEAYAERSDLEPGDCWDDPDTAPADFTVVGSSLTDKNGGQLSWAQPTAAEVHPGADDTWYDGVDQDCDAHDDFDQDDDGYRTEAYPDQAGEYGDDCIDGNALDDENIAGDEARDVNPAAAEVWYDGTDQDCDDNDCDQDGDGYDYDGSALCERQECDDEDAAAFPNGDPEWVWYDGQDNNCDGNEGDQDGDGYWVADYAERVAASGSGYEPQDIPSGMEGDCWDVPLAVEDAPTEYQALNGLTQPDADEVFPAATDAFYDGIDQDCAGGDDFDQDGDDHHHDTYADREGAVGDDCDDTDGAVYPGYPESYYDGTDQDCDGNDGDADGDGYWHEDYTSLVHAAGGTPLTIPSDCGPSGTLSCAGDCNDSQLDSYAPSVHPDRLEDCATEDDDDCDGDTNEDTDPGEDALSCTWYYLDNDRDSYGTIAGTSLCLCGPDSTRRYTTLDHSDCDDATATTYPGATEHCDGVDSDCDGTLDEDDAVEAQYWYADTDNDTYGDPAVSDFDCYVPTGYVADDTDCDDGRALTNPAATEYCNAHDDDCDGDVDEDDADDARTWYQDSDEDNFGNSSVSLTQCYQPTGYILASAVVDCDDTDSGDYPGATEIVGNGDDEDCDGHEVCYDDDDNDGYLDATGDTRTSTDVDCADANEGTNTDPTTDCNDAVAAINPAATETVGDEVDYNCDGRETCYQDTDDDGYLLASPSTRSSTDTDCTDQYEGRATDPFTDCDDSDANDHPGATETVGNGDDEDCDGGEICYADADHDAYRSSTLTVTSTDADCSDTGEALSTAGIDCLDSNANAFPGAAELESATSCREDADADGYGDISPPSGVTAGTDCDDASASDYPGAPETVADGDDDDCDGVDSCYQDLDGDNYGTSTVVDGSSLDCDSGTGSLVATDCDDTDSADHPGATETIGNGDDEDCDGGEICYADADHDLYRATTTVTSTDTDCSDAGEALSTAG